MIKNSTIERALLGGIPGAIFGGTAVGFLGSKDNKIKNIFSGAALGGAGGALLTSSPKHMAYGAMAAVPGSAMGAGLSYLMADEEDDKLDKMIEGALYGSTAGGLAGAGAYELSSRGITSDKINS
jgi:hypothetical protein